MANIFGDIWDQFKKRTVTENGRRIFYPFGTPKGSTGNTAGNIGTNTAQTKVNQNVFKSNPWSNPAPSYADPNINFRPVATTMYDRPAGPPAPKKETTTVTPSQPTVSYDQKYQDYLKNRTETANTLAQQAEEEARKKAQEDYDLEKGSLNSQLSNLTSALSSYKTNRNADVDAYNQTVERGKENARTASGSTQRTLAKTRQDQLNQNQKTYAALGTVDSYGVGSFSGANANTESDFLRMTNENYKNLEDKLYTLDQDALSYKRKADMDMAEQDSKYNDAVIQINKLLAGNENAKRQALQAASQLLSQKKAEIQDEYDGLMLQIEKDKYTSAQALNAEKAKGQEVMKAWQSTSGEFRKSGKVTDMNDVFFVNNYKDAYESMMKNGGMSSAKTDTANEMVNVIDQLVKTGGVGGITGIVRNDFIPGTKAALAKNYYNQLKGMLSLENRQKLKGSGAISDYESKVLAQAASALDQNLSETQFMQVLNDLRNKLSNQPASQSQQEIRVQDKKTGQYGFISPNEFDPNLYIQA